MITSQFGQFDTKLSGYSHNITSLFQASILVGGGSVINEAYPV